MLTVEQIELRKLIKQELADAGINRTTLTEMVKQAIEEKVEQKANEIVKGAEERLPWIVENAVNKTIRYDDVVKRSISDYVKNRIVNIELSFIDGDKKTTTTIS